MPALETPGICRRIFPFSPAFLSYRKTIFSLAANGGFGCSLAAASAGCPELLRMFGCSSCLRKQNSARIFSERVRFEIPQAEMD